MVDESKIFEQMQEEIKKGTVRHRRCDVCGCELAIPDIGLYSRDVFVSMACTQCSYTKAHSVFLGYIEDLRKSHTKPDVLRILDEQMTETLGEADIFTIDEWNELMNEEKQKITRCAVAG